MFRLLLIILLTAGTALSTVTLVNPPDCQLPLIARVNQPYSWTLSANTFSASDGPAQVSASYDARWLSFDPGTLNFHGTPSDQDEGTFTIVLIACDSDSSETSSVTLVVTSSPAPTLHISIQDQFYAGNPSLSSVFAPHPGSSIATANPTLRIPSGWSFSIGFRGDTFNSAGDVFYNALQSDGSPLLDWMVFNTKTFTLNGVVPVLGYSSPWVLPLRLHASDREGYTASALPFDLVIASHEISFSGSSLPTINITASTYFCLSLSSPDDFNGALVDGKAIQPSDIASLFIDVSPYADWLKYDATSRTLSGTPPDDLVTPSHSLPVTIASNFNQSLRTNVSLAIVPSFFSSPALTPIRVSVQDAVHFNLVEYFSNATAPGMQRDDVNLTAAFDPDKAHGLVFDSQTARLTGSIPASFPSDLLNVTFTAYSHITHSTSHTTLSISVLSRSSKKEIRPSHPSGLSASAHARLVVGLVVTFGLVGGLALLGAILAILRHWARVNDTALSGEAAANAWTDNDRKWYGISTETGRAERGYGWTEKAGRPAMDIENPFGLRSPDAGGFRKDRPLGLALQRVLTRTPSNPATSRFPGASIRSPGAVMRKAEFLGKIRETVRKVSDKYVPSKPATQRRLVIGKPILVTRVGANPDEVLPFENAHVVEAPNNPFEDVDLRNYAASTVGTLSDSPTSSTEDRSIPRRRADFAPAKSPLTQLEDPSGHGRVPSTASESSLMTNGSANTHAEEAVVQTARRATSIRSARSASAVSYQSLLLERPDVGPTRPRLIPFTGATRVPVPRLASGAGHLDQKSAGLNPRAASQTATVVDMEKGGALDDLSVGMHYVRSLGGDRRASGGSASAVFFTEPSTRTVSTNVRSSFSSLASSRQAGGEKVKRFLVRAGERFKFRVAVTGDVGRQALVARLMSGQATPDFLRIDLEGAVQRRGMVEFSGVPGVGDVGEVNLGVYTAADGVCVARIVVEVVGRST